MTNERISRHTPKSLRAIRVKYSRKNQEAKIPYKLDFNVHQFSAIDSCIDQMKDKLKVEVSKAVLIRACVAEYTNWVKAVLESDSKQDLVILLRQLESASQDR